MTCNQKLMAFVLRGRAFLSWLWIIDEMFICLSSVKVEKLQYQYPENVLLIQKSCKCNSIRFDLKLMLWQKWWVIRNKQPVSIIWSINVWVLFISLITLKRIFSFVAYVGYSIHTHSHPAGVYPTEPDSSCQTVSEPGLSPNVNNLILMQL